MRRVTLLAALLVALIALPAASAEAAPAAATGVHGWKASARTTTAGAVLRIPVRIDGPARTVLLQRRVDGAWRTVDTVREKGGTAVLRWRTPAEAGTATLRLRVRASTGWAAAVTCPHRITTSIPSTGTVTPAPTATATPSTFASRVLTLVNAARATGRTCGDTAYPAVGALAADTRIDGVAQAYAERMATEGFFAHTAPDGSSMADRMHAAGYDGWIGENIAAGQPDADAVVAAWLASPGHCANIMGAHYRRLGTGFARSTSAPYPTYWVQDFSS